jgi:hypothetical protein
MPLCSPSVGDAFVNLNLHYTLTQDDYLKAQDLFARHNSLMSRAVVHASPVFGVLLIAAAILNLWNAPRSWLSSFLCVFWGMFLLLWRRFSLARTFMKEKRLHQQFDVVIDDQGVELSNANGKTVSLWSAFDKFAESDGIFLLFCGQRTFHLIPKRAFASGQERQLRELLREKIPSRR